MKMTKKKIEQVAKDIREFLDSKFLNGDCRIYFNGKCWEHGAEDEPITWEGHNLIDKPKRYGWKEIANINPKDYIDYADGIITMSFEGSFYNTLNYPEEYDYATVERFNDLLRAYGLCYEMGNAWNLSIYKI